MERNLLKSLSKSLTEPGLSFRLLQCQGSALSGKELWETKLGNKIKLLGSQRDQTQDQGHLIIAF